MTNNNLEQRILDRIKQEKIEPKSKWFFVFKNISYWLLFAFSVLLGSVSFASVLYKLTGNYEVVQDFVSDKFTLFDSLPFILPYFWIIIFSIFFVLAIYNYKKTKGFYKYQMSFIVLLLSVSVFVGGYLMYVFGVAEKTEEISQKYLPFYNKYEMIQNLRKDVFVEKLKELGVTKKILENSPELKKKIEDKFDKNVLGKTYIFRKPEVCLEENFVCLEKEIFFEDKKGCGCRDVYTDIKLKL